MTPQSHFQVFVPENLNLCSHENIYMNVHSNYSGFIHNDLVDITPNVLFLVNG